GLHDICAFFDACTVRKLRKEYESFPQPELSSVEGMLEFQLALLASRICSDYAISNSFYAEHAEGFRRQLSRVLIRNDFTDEINWLAARDAMSTLLERNFKSRYDGLATQHGSFYRASRLANEALCIAKWIISDGLQRPLSRTTSQIGRDFEQSCGARLNELGFEVEYTSTSGDFGCDIVATKDGLRYAVQCKGREMTAGVTAVQEAAAARSHYKTDYAVVISQSGYTKAARDLAASTRVVLVTDSGVADVEALARSLEST
ncbi:MAG: restriction endonuclease, partial [Nitrospira sp.]|nr:restriction endonuclease [Nitrospira sp.]